MQDSHVLLEGARIIRLKRTQMALGNGNVWIVPEWPMLLKVYLHRRLVRTQIALVGLVTAAVLRLQVRCQYTLVFALKCAPIASVHSCVRVMLGLQVPLEVAFL